MEHCARCRRELECIANEATHFLALRNSLPAVDLQPDAGLEKLLGRIRAWQSARHDTVRKKIHEHVAFQLEVFFGSRAADLVARSAFSRQDAGVVLAAEPLFAAFLGQRAAARLSSMVYEQARLSDGFAREQAP